MDNPIRTTLQNLIKNQATADEIEFLQQALSSGQIFIGGNVRNSVIIVGSGNTVELSSEALERLTAANHRSSLHQLPQPPADFIGREQELKKIFNNLDKKSGAAISGLVGMGGIGKTALGLAAAHGLIEQYPEAQFFIDMRGTSSNPLKPEDAMKHVVQSVYPTEDLKNATEAELAGIYQSVLAEKKSILFLDNAHDATQVAPLRSSANCFMLVTSRRHFAVPGLHTIKVDALKEKDAIRLLMEICPRLTRSEARQIARQCSCLPIALRLAASYLSVHTSWTPNEYITNLMDRTKRLESLNHDGTDINIVASFEQSYQQLTPDEQRYWNMLAVFPISFTRDALVSVLDMDAATVRKLVDKLCRYSLLDYDLSTARYRLHDLLADFAFTKLTTNDRSSAQLHYFRHYRDVWFAAEETYIRGSENVLNGLSLFDSEFGHIESAYHWAMENVARNQDLWHVLKEMPAFISVARLRLHPERQIAWFSAVLVSAQKLGDKHNQNKALGNIGGTYSIIGENRKAIEYAEQALEIACTIGDRLFQGKWLANIGAAYSYLGENGKAIEYIQQSLVIARENSDLRSQGVCLGNIGNIYANLGESLKAIEYMQQALEIAREIGDRTRQGLWLGDIGAIYGELGENRKAIEYMEQALEIALEMDDHGNQGEWRGNIGTIYANLGEHRKAIEYLEQALQIAHETGDRQNQGAWLGHIGDVYANLEESCKAIEYLEQALEIALEIGDRQNLGLWLGHLGRVYGSLGENCKAIDKLSQALEIAREVGSQQIECECLIDFGELHIKMHETDAAKERLESALAISKKLALYEQKGKSLFALAKLSRLENNKEIALEYAEQARSTLESFKSPKLAEVNQFIECINHNP